MTKALKVNFWRNSPNAELMLKESNCSVMSLNFPIILIWNEDAEDLIILLVHDLFQEGELILVLIWCQADHAVHSRWFEGRFYFISNQGDGVEALLLIGELWTEIQFVLVACEFVQFLWFVPLELLLHILLLKSFLLIQI